MVFTNTCINKDVFICVNKLLKWVQMAEQVCSIACCSVFPEKLLKDLLDQAGKICGPYF